MITVCYFMQVCSIACKDHFQFLWWYWIVKYLNHGLSEVNLNVAARVFEVNKIVPGRNNLKQVEPVWDHPGEAMAKILKRITLNSDFWNPLNSKTFIFLCRFWRSLLERLSLMFLTFWPKPRLTRPGLTNSLTKPVGRRATLTVRII